MSHDKIRDAARRRMAETGESFATARREVIKNHRDAGAAPSSGARFFALDYSDMGRVSLRTDTRHGGGPGRGGVVLDATMVRVLVPGFRLDLPRASVRSATRATRPAGLLRNAIGVHSSRGRWLVNGSHNGLVELTIEPPGSTPRQPSTLFRKMRVSSLIVSVADPDGFIAAVDGGRPAAP